MRSRDWSEERSKGIAFLGSHKGPSLHKSKEAVTMAELAHRMQI
jgi:hypothetical protein